MIYVDLPTERQREVSFYLAMEEYVARNFEGDDYFFMWQTSPSVIFGRNQLIENEVNTAYCIEHGILTFRRKSGGGCVYSDRNNIMLSYITKDENVNFTFNRYLNMIALCLYRLGVEAKATGRNDIMIDGKKVSGNAFYHLHKRSIVHGTLLYDTDMANMTASITPPGEKLQSKGVESIRQHIALLKDYINIGIDELKLKIRNTLCNDSITLTLEDVAEIEKIEQEYLTKEFIYGNNPKYNIVRKGRIEGVGDIEIRLELKNQIIMKINILGDYFLTGDLSENIIKPLEGVKLEREAIENVLPDTTEETIRNLRRDDFINLLTNEK